MSVLYYNTHYATDCWKRTSRVKIESEASRSNRRRQDGTPLREERHTKEKQSCLQIQHFAGFMLKREWGGGLVIS